VLGKIFTTLGAGVGAILVVVIATIATFAIPVVAILWIGHLGPFAKHTESPSSIAFCSTLNQMTSYAASHPTPTTASQFVTQISYSRDQLAGMRSIPTDIKGTVSATLTTSNQILALLQGAIATGGWSGNEEQQTVALDRVFITEASTLKKWYYANC
jgi:hypothetical protein